MAIGAICIGPSIAMGTRRHDAERDPWHESGEKVLPLGTVGADFVPDRVTTDGHNSYPRAIRSTLGRKVRHRTNVYLNNKLEQDHRGIKGRIRCMRGFKEHDAADRFCREYDELRNFLRSRCRHNQYVPAPVDAVTSSIMLASRWASCKPLDQSIRAAHCTANGARHDRSDGNAPFGQE
jgi:hypothetical protein